ncbi:hypothetical protein B0J18DRAFT_473458 [Chaetomium sp. MPI-SDFR-AT-0129]|nr:hypothetical protein B0J18DRAFT_473458 [Chaetomium sp. MPI-SDFR-AT-0129]
MVSPELASGNLSPHSAKDAPGPADGERQEFMNDGYVLNIREIEDWAFLSSDTINQKVAWLKFREPFVDLAKEARPLDVETLTARLQAIVDNPDAPRRPPRFRPVTSSQITTPRCDKNEYKIAGEWAAYHDLVETGGRPLYDISRLYQIARNRPAYREFLRPFQTDPTSDVPCGCELQSQRDRWCGFRVWQRLARGIWDPEKEFDADFEREERQKAVEIYALGSESDHQRREEAHCKLEGKRVRRRFEKAQEERQQEKGKERESGVQNAVDEEEAFAAWAETDKRERVEMGLTWPGMTLAEKRQAKRVMFDMWESYRHGQLSLLRDGREWGGFQQYTQEVQERLAKHGFDRPSVQLHQDPAQQDDVTTWIEYLCYEYHWYDQYDGAVKSPPSGRQKLPEISKRLDEDRCLTPSEKILYQHAILIQWILDQLPLIEAELTQHRRSKSKSPEPRVDRGHDKTLDAAANTSPTHSVPSSSSTQSRKRSPPNDAESDRPTSRARLDNVIRSSPEQPPAPLPEPIPTAPAPAAPSPAAPAADTNRHNPPNAPPRRRSARIAARVAAATAAAAAAADAAAAAARENAGERNPDPAPRRPRRRQAQPRQQQQQQQQSPPRRKADAKARGEGVKGTKGKAKTGTRTGKKDDGAGGGGTEKKGKGGKKGGGNNKGGVKKGKGKG